MDGWMGEDALHPYLGRSSPSMGKPFPSRIWILPRLPPYTAHQAPGNVGGEEGRGEREPATTGERG